MAAFFGAAVEARLNRLFIHRSGSRRQAPAMSSTASPLNCYARRPASWRRCALAWLVVGLGVLGASGAWAGDDKDHDRVRDAVRAGEVMPLDALRERLRRDHAGEVLELELEREDGRWIYEVKLLQRGGRIVKLEVDARSGEVLRERRGRRR
jgi:hypothetical protein